MFLASNCTCAVSFTYNAHVQLLAQNMTATHVHAFAYAIKQTPYAFVAKIILCMYLGYVHTVTFLHGFVLFHNPKGIPVYFQTIENDAKTLPCAHSLTLCLGLTSAATFYVRRSLALIISSRDCREADSRDTSPRHACLGEVSRKIWLHDFAINNNGGSVPVIFISLFYLR